jgi:hypothetical protein
LLLQSLPAEADMLRALLALVIAFLVACGLTVVLQGQSAGEPRVWRIPEVPADLKPALATADTIIVAQHSALLRELTRTLAEGGPALAIRSCHLEATMNAQWVGRQRGYAIGRTSDRLRNPINRPPAWAAEIVKREAGRSAAVEDGFVADLADRVGVLRPIAMQPMCNACHGPEDSMSPAVRAELVDRYPADRAIGFRKGELRGWYWAEIPKAAGRAPVR